MSKKFTAFLIVICLLIDANLVFALTFNKSNSVPISQQSNVTESKIYDQYKYLMQNRGLGSTSSLLEANKTQITEFDDVLVNKHSLNSIVETNYDFGFGQAIYDGNIGIIDFKDVDSGNITYEAPYYCDVIIVALAKFFDIDNNVCISSYSAFDALYQVDPNRTYVNTIKVNELSNADLSRYSVIIFPDFTLGKHSDILVEMGETGRANLKNFVETGGISYFSSKSIIIALGIPVSDQ